MLVSTGKNDSLTKKDKDLGETWRKHTWRSNPNHRKQGVLTSTDLESAAENQALGDPQVTICFNSQVMVIHDDWMMQGGYPYDLGNHMINGKEWLWWSIVIYS
jgi:hypothetical protein